MANERILIVEENAETRLKQIQHWFTATLKFIGDAIVTTDREGNILFLNPVAETLTGWTQAEALNRKSAEVLPLLRGETRALILDPVRTVMAGGTVLSLTQGGTLVAKDGREIPVTGSMAPIQDEQGVIIGTVLILRDVTERKRTEFRQAQMARLGHRLNAANFFVEAARQIVDTARNLFGWDACSLELYAAESDLVSPLLTIDTIDGQSVEGLYAYESAPPTPLIEHILKEGATLILRTTASPSETGLIPFGDKGRLSSSLMFVPVRNGTRVLGFLSIQSYSENTYTQDDLHLLQAMADHCGGALERIHSREALQKSEERFHAFMRNTPVAAFIKDAAGRYLYGNPTWASQFNKLPEELFGKTDFDLWPADVASEFQKSDAAARASEKSLETVEESTQPDGSKTHWIAIKFSMPDDSNQKLVGGLAFDITARKLAEEELNHSREQLRSLAAHLQLVREEERIRISREIHDQLGQLITTFKMDLSWLEKRLRGMSGQPEPLSLLDKVETMTSLADEMVQSVRRIASELRPGALDDLGLVPALDWQARGFALRTGIACEFSSDLGTVELDPDLSTGVFRIFQETLTNVARHAQATQVSVQVIRRGDCLVLKIRDNGCGITQQELRNSKSLGLLGMRERVMLLGGQFEISGSAGQGTVVEVRIPFVPRPTHPGGRGSEAEAEGRKKSEIR